MLIINKLRNNNKKCSYNQVFFLRLKKIKVANNSQTKNAEDVLKRLPCGLNGKIAVINNEIIIALLN